MKTWKAAAIISLTLLPLALRHARADDSQDCASLRAMEVAVAAAYDRDPTADTTREWRSEFVRRLGEVSMLASIYTRMAPLTGNQAHFEKLRDEGERLRAVYRNVRDGREEFDVKVSILINKLEESYAFANGLKLNGCGSGEY